MIRAQKKTRNFGSGSAIAFFHAADNSFKGYPRRRWIVSDEAWGSGCKGVYIRYMTAHPGSHNEV